MHIVGSWCSVCDAAPNLELCCVCLLQLVWLSNNELAWIFLQYLAHVLWSAECKLLTSVQLVGRKELWGKPDRAHHPKAVTWMVLKHGEVFILACRKSASPHFVLLCLGGTDYCCMWLHPDDIHGSIKTVRNFGEHILQNILQLFWIGHCTKHREMLYAV